jgi:hypothetical protein
MKNSLNTIKDQKELFPPNKNIHMCKIAKLQFPFQKFTMKLQLVIKAAVRANMQMQNLILKQNM